MTMETEEESVKSSLPWRLACNMCGNIMSIPDGYDNKCVVCAKCYTTNKVPNRFK